MDKKLFLLDMDGTIYLGNKIFDVSLEFLNRIKESGGRYMFLTNNSSKGTDEYIKKLRKMGIDSSYDDFYTSADATAQYLMRKAYNKIYVFGTKALISHLRSFDLPVTDKLEDGIDCLLMGFDTELSFNKMEDACKLLNNDIAYIATNPDWVCPTEYGYVPDCGSICDIMRRATGKVPKFIGKPNPEMIELAIEKSGYTKEEAIIFGDRLYTDIASGVNAGITTAFVLSGEGTLEDVESSDIKPDFIFENVLEYFVR